MLIDSAAAPWAECPPYEVIHPGHFVCLSTLASLDAASSVAGAAGILRNACGQRRACRSPHAQCAGQTVSFEISLRQARGSNKIKGVIKESYTGFGTLKDGFVWADITGTCESEDGFTHLQFTKTYRHSKEPPVAYRGSLPPGSSLLAGTWYFPHKPSDSGMFQISNLHVQ